MGDAAVPLQRRCNGKLTGLDILAGEHAVKHDACPHQLIMLVKIGNAGGIIHVTDGNGKAFLMQQFHKSVEFFRLLPCFAQIFAVCAGEMAENTFCKKSRQAGDLHAQLGRFLRGLKADAAHAGVDGKMEGRNFTLSDGLPGEGQRIFVMENGGADIFCHRPGEIGLRGMPQNQNGGLQAGLP